MIVGECVRVALAIKTKFALCTLDYSIENMVPDFDLK